MKSIILIGILALSGCAHVSPARLDGSCPTDFSIKGNADSVIYHTPDSPYYFKTRAEICFDSAHAAKRHGFRPVSPYSVAPRRKR